MERVGSNAADPASSKQRSIRLAGGSFHSPIYAALDLGTNNCRLLIARQQVESPDTDALRIIDSFCRIVRLGEGVAASGRLSDAAMDRTIAALSVCRDKMAARRVSRMRLVATEACRAANNSPAFVARVERETGLRLEVVDQETEALLATAGCASLADPDADAVLLFDIGGGSSELVWLGRAQAGWRADRRIDGELRNRIKAWESLRLGVVTLAERFGGQTVTSAIYEAMVDFVGTALEPFAAQVAALPSPANFHLLGTSGTVTTIAGVFLNLPRYDRKRVDGLWMSWGETETAIAILRGMSFAERVTNACIGIDRADLVLAGCAIFEAIGRAFPSTRVRIADRGLREGMLMQMMAADRIWAGRC